MMATEKTRRKKSVKPTKQDLAFARLVANGARKIDAFRQTHPGIEEKKPSTQTMQMNRILEKVEAYIDEYRSKVTDGEVMSRLELLHRLTSYVRENHESGRDAAFLAGAKLLAQIAGYEAPQKVETAVRVEMSEKSEKELLLIAGIDTHEHE